MAKKNSVAIPDIKFAEKLDTSNLSSFTMDEVMSLLSALPKTKYVYGVDVVDKSKTLDQAKYDMKRELAVAHMNANTNKEALNLGSADDRKAYALNDDNVIQAEVAVVEATGAYEFAKLQFDYADDLFISIRKIATIVEKQLDAQKEVDKYSNPYQKTA